MHYNGQPENVFPALVKYTTTESVLNLIKGGRILEIESTLTEEEAMGDLFRMKSVPASGEPSYFFREQPWGRQGHTWDEVKPQRVIYNKFHSMKMSVDDYEAIYHYLFNPETDIWSFTQLVGPCGAMWGYVQR